MNPDRRRELEALVERAATRSDCRRLGAWLDAAGGTWKKDLAALARERGVALPEEAALWSGKRLIRRARARETTSRIRSNPIRRDEAFVCAACGRDVTPGGSRVRDHCPYCLVSLHVDRVPGDREADCGGRLIAVGLELVGGNEVIGYRCSRCDTRNRVRAHPDDDRRALEALASREGG